MLILPEIILNDARSTLETGSRLGQGFLSAWRNHEIALPFLITLEGDLGVGKTTISQALCRALGVPESQDVLSPTFTLANEYNGIIDIFHLDVYRLNPEEFYDAGLDEYLSRPGLCLVEWPDKMPDSFWPERLRLAMDFKGESRTLKISGKISPSIANALIG